MNEKIRAILENSSTDEKSLRFLYDYMNASAPVGRERQGQKIWLDYVSQYADETKVDSYGSAWVIYKADKSVMLPKKVVIEAHCDEIAWQITNIEKDGFIRVDKAGGSDNMIASSKIVNIHTHDGRKVRGVFGSPAIHVRDKRTVTGPEIHELWIDAGFDSDEDAIKAGVEVGNLVTFEVDFSMIGDYYTGKSLDNKIGGYIIAEVLKHLKLNNVKLPFDLYVVNCVQEEVGLFGARKVAKAIQADIALVHDVCHDTNTPKLDKSKEGDIKGGKGPVIEYTAQNQQDIVAKIREVAAKYEVPLQLSVGSYGNDTVSFFLENTPTAIIASPLKYMHTTVEMVNRHDVNNAIILFAAMLKNITPEWIEEVKNPTWYKNK